MVCVKANYSERINTLLSGWKIANDKSSNEAKFQNLTTSQEAKFSFFNRAGHCS